MHGLPATRVSCPCLADVEITVAGRLTGGFRTIVSDLVAVIQVEELDARDL